MKRAFTLLMATVLLAFAGTQAQNARKYATQQSDASRQAMSLGIMKPVKAKAAKSVASPKSVGDTVSTFPWLEGFESGNAPVGFSFVDADNDSYGWDYTFLYGNSAGHNNSNGLIASASYINNYGALTPNNWMILPAFQLPANTTGWQLSWWEKGQDASYSAEYYSVYISTAGNSVSNFTATTAVLTSTTTSSWMQKTVDLSSYAGQTIFVAFRHYNVSDMYWLDIDDMRVGDPNAVDPPTVSISGPATVQLNQPATFTANASTSTVAWSVDGTVQTTTGTTLTYTFTTVGTHQVVVSATNAAGTVSDSLTVNAVDCGTAISTFPWIEDFESGSEPGCFTMFDGDADGNNWEYIYSQGYGIGHNGSDGMMISASYDNDNGVALTPNNWMILPGFAIPAGSTDFELTWWEKGQDSNWVAEYYSVYISTNGNTVASFIAGSPVLTSTVTANWVQKSVSLANYAGQTIYVAFRHYNVTDMFWLDIDDIRVGGPAAPDIHISGPTLLGVNQPATYTATSTVTSVNWYVDGTQQTATGLTMTCSFATLGNHQVVASATNSVGTTSDTLDVYVGASHTITVINNGGGYLAAALSEDEELTLVADTLAFTSIEGDSLYIQTVTVSPESDYYGEFSPASATMLTAVYVDGVQVPITVWATSISDLMDYMGLIIYSTKQGFDADHTVELVFGPWGSNDHTVTVSSSDPTLGIVYGAGQYADGEQAVLMAFAQGGTQFNGWSNGEMGNPLIVTVTDDINIMAYFSVGGIVIHDTLVLHDTVVVHDTVYITDNAIDGVETTVAKIYASQGRIVVESADGTLLPSVRVFDVQGRVIDSSDILNTRFETVVPATGAYLIKVGDHPARRVVVVR